MSNVYSNTPTSFPSYPSFPTSGSSSDASATAGATGAISNTYLPTSNRRYVNTGRAMSDSSAEIFSDLMFRFLGVKTDTCKRRFICELEFRNPFMNYALNYMG